MESNVISTKESVEQLDDQKEKITETNTQQSKGLRFGRWGITPYPYLLIYLVPLLVSLGLFYGLWMITVAHLFIFAVVPVAEYILGNDGVNPTKEESKQLENQYSFRLLTMVWVPSQWAVLFLCCYGVSPYFFRSFSWIEFIGIAIGMGTVSGAIGINVSHELMHKPSRLEQNLSKALLLCSCYMHFYIEHLHGHHKRVATFEDPASSRYGETVYEFVPRCIIGSYMSAWEIEVARLNKYNLPVWSPLHNQMIQFAILPVLVFSAISLAFGLIAGVLFVGQAIVSVIFLELINYIEHYGLQRKEIKSKSGQKAYEQVSPLHSWNADTALTNFFTFKLQRHADHHTWPFRRYQTLRTWDFSPQLPTGYMGMIMMSLIPPLFFSVMNPKVNHYNSMLDSLVENVENNNYLSDKKYF